MHILFDNGTPRQLRLRLFGHVVEEARERGWDAFSNGDLLDRAEEAGFEVLITTDQGHPASAEHVEQACGRGRFDEYRLAAHLAENGSHPHCFG